jgi:hypothetical protein
MKHLTLITFLSILTSCSTALTAEGSKVQIVHHLTKAKDCKFVSVVQATSMMGGLLQGAAYDKSINELRNKAGKLGANLVALTNNTNNWGGTNLSGNAYKCPRE